MITFLTRVLEGLEKWGREKSPSFDSLRDSLMERVRWGKAPFEGNSLVLGKERVVLIVVWENIVPARCWTWWGGVWVVAWGWWCRSRCNCRFVPRSGVSYREHYLSEFGKDSKWNSKPASSKRHRKCCRKSIELGFSAIGWCIDPTIVVRIVSLRQYEQSSQDRTPCTRPLALSSPLPRVAETILLHQERQEGL